MLGLNASATTSGLIYILILRTRLSLFLFSFSVRARRPLKPDSYLLQILGPKGLLTLDTSVSEECLPGLHKRQFETVSRHEVFKRVFFLCLFVNLYVSVLS